MALFLAPFGVLFAGMFIAPIGYALYESFFVVKKSGLGFGAAERSFAGLDQYTRVLADDQFRSAIGRMALFGIVQVPVMLGLALLLALFLDSNVAWLGRFFRLAFFIPYAVPGVVGALLWAFLYQKGTSPFQGALEGVFGGSANFLSPSVVLWSIANITTWAWTGYNMLIIYSALQAAPRELYEAARVDGCSGWRLAWHVKIPLVRPALVLTGVFSIIGTFQLFNEPAILKDVAPAVSSVFTPIMVAQNAAFGLNDYNYSAAVSVVLALLTGVLSFGFLHLTREKS